MLAVLVVLGIMVALVGPFLVSMSQSGAAAEQEASVREARVLVRSLRDSALQSIAESQGDADPTPSFDGREEFPEYWTPPVLAEEQAGPDAEEHPLGETRPLQVELHDVQGRIFAPTMPQQVWANHFAWWAVLAQDLEPDESEELSIRGGEGLPDAGYIWIDNECVRYERKEGGRLSGLTRGWSPAGEVKAGTIPDPYGPAAKHRSGTSIHDMRVRLLATWAFDPMLKPRRGQRRDFVPFASVEDIARVECEPFGGFARDKVEALRRLLVFDSARVDGGMLGRAERVFNTIRAGETLSLVVKDGSSFPPGTVVCVEIGDSIEWSLVVSLRFQGRGSSARLPGGGRTLVLDRPLALSAGEEEARVRPLLPVPVNINTADAELLALLFEALRSHRLGKQQGGSHDPLPRSKAKLIAERILQMRSYDPESEEAVERPFENWQALHERVLEPLRDEKLLSNAELFHLYAQMMNGLDQRLDQARVPVAFESSGLVEYRAAAAVLSGAGRTLARREVQGLALPQPARSVERLYATQERFDEATRLSRSRPYWSTGPMATTLRQERNYQEPPDPAFAQLLPWLKGESARWPSQSESDSVAMLGTSRLPNLHPFSMGASFPLANHPEGRDLSAQPSEPLLVEVSAETLSTAVRQMIEKVAKGAEALLPMSLRFGSGQGGGMGIGWGLSAWWKPRSLRESVLFDLNGGEAFRNRIFLGLDSQGLSLRLYDNAGQDPDPGVTQPTETALRWEVPIDQAALEKDLWFHTAIEIARGSPSGLALFTDGALLGKPAYLSYAREGLGELSLDLKPEISFAAQLQAMSQPLSVEDGSSFPEKGVYRIGNELYEATRNGNKLNPRLDDSMGGRMARGTFRIQDSGGQNSLQLGQNPGQRGFLNRRAFADACPAGASLELYGYSNPVLRDSFIVPGKAKLQGSCGRWRPLVVLEAPDDVVLNEGSRSLKLGKGLLEDSHTAKLVLGPADGSNARVSGLDSAGGYAVLVQRRYRWLGPRVQGKEIRIEENVGGVELVRYSGFAGSAVTITRGNFQLGVLPRSPSGNAGASASGADYLTKRHFVTEWNKELFTGDPNAEETMWCYFVPVSIAITGGLNLRDPAELGYSNYLQIYNPNDESKCEWVRYDKLADNGRYALRIHPRALRNLEQLLTTQRSQRQKEPSAQGPYQVDTGDRVLVEPPRTGWPRIGEPDSKETALEYSARLRFRFRGDPFTGTATHEQANCDVMPVFRTLFSWRLELGRPGRGDRVALMTGADSANQYVDWQTVNWSARVAVEYASRLPLGGSFASQAGDPVGPIIQGQREPRFNLVALRDGAQYLYQGRRFVPDTRRLDRMVKFPSGELPMQLDSKAYVGRSGIEGLPFDGLVDKLRGYLGQAARAGANGAIDSLYGVLAAPVSAADMTWKVAFSPSSFSIGGAGVHGGLLLVGGEIVGWTRRDRSNGTLEIASNGRGLLGSEARAHGAGTHVHWVSCRPASFLSVPMQAKDDSFAVAYGRALPQQEGTVLIGKELLHYCWSRSQDGGMTLLHMPSGETWSQGGEDSLGRSGLFRGRYGTTAAPHGNGEMVISWPFRYWDRFKERADDPELAYLGFSAEMPDIFVTRVSWEEEIPDPTLDLVLLVRCDERAPWTADPRQNPWLWRFRHPRSPSGDPELRVMAQGSKWEFRFGALYRSGAFDPERFRATGWKRTPILRKFSWSYEGQTRIFRERESSR
ncbi:MAG: hypothetical protein CSA62_11005 [Planctomycetota bacterium]|nr:MAG: hypothetical protein CSA62_11005 [Planctomycetota bacterium]